MKPLDLTPRLAAVAAQVPQGARLADVGTDHAYLPVWLLLAGRIVGAVATDVNQGPMQRGRRPPSAMGWPAAWTSGGVTAWQPCPPGRWTPW